MLSCLNNCTVYYIRYSYPETTGSWYKVSTCTSPTHYQWRILSHPPRGTFNVSSRFTWIFFFFLVYVWNIVVKNAGGDAKNCFHASVREDENVMDRSTWYPFTCHTPYVMIKNCIWHKTRVQRNCKLSGWRENTAREK